jgi:hypothetical protein
MSRSDGMIFPVRKYNTFVRVSKPSVEVSVWSDSPLMRPGYGGANENSR